MHNRNIFSRSLFCGFFASLLALLVFSSCESPYTVHEYKNLPEAIWHYDSAASFQFMVEDPAKPYDLYYHIRNNREYPFYNLYVKTELLDGEGKLVRKKLHEVNLMHPKDGTPLGNGESLYDHEILLFPNMKFEKSGNYQFNIKQYMRLDTLEGVTAVGLSLMPVVQEGA